MISGRLEAVPGVLESGRTVAGLGNAKPIRILLIEDNNDDAMMVREAVGGVQGVRLDLQHVDTLSAGLERLAQNDTDVVLLDLSLRDSQGLGTLAKVKQQALDLPVIVLTGSDEEMLGTRAVQEGAQDYLVKGRVDGNTLIRATRYAIERHQLMMVFEQQTLELKSSETRLRTIIETNVDGVLIIDRHGYVRFANPAAEALFERSGEQLVDHPFEFPLVAGEVGELEIVRSDDKTTVAEMRVVETHWEGEAVRLASLRDITERKQVEHELRRLDRMKSEFIDSISYELRTPIHSIMGFSSLMMDGKVTDSETHRSFLTRISRLSHKLAKLIDNLLDASRIETSEFTVRKRSLSLQHVIGDVVDELFGLGIKKGMAILKDIPEKLPVIEADEERLK
jgi:signal transduction histidine kinase